MDTAGRHCNSYVCECAQPKRDFRSYKGGLRHVFVHPHLRMIPRQQTSANSSFWRDECGVNRVTGRGRCSYKVSSRVNDDEHYFFQVPLCCAYPSVTTNEQ